MIVIIGDTGYPRVTVTLAEAGPYSTRLDSDPNRRTPVRSAPFDGYVHLRLPLLFLFLLSVRRTCLSHALPLPYIAPGHPLLVPRFSATRPYRCLPLPPPPLTKLDPPAGSTLSTDFPACRCGTMSADNIAASLEHLGIRTDNEIVVVDNEETLGKLKQALHGMDVIAWDCEGVKLSRFGSVSLIQFAVEEVPNCYTSFLLDLLSPIRDDLISFAKGVLENGSILKIIHDPASDSDCVFHKHNIKVVNVHDTQAWHMAIKQCNTRTSLNDTLESWGLPSNTSKGKTFNPYINNPTYWESRPLTTEMIEIAAGDVHTTIPLYRKQIECWPSQQKLCQRAKTNSEARVRVMRDLPTFEVRVSEFSVGSFIGRKGSNIVRMEKAIEGCIVGNRFSDRKIFTVYTDMEPREAVRVMSGVSDVTVTLLDKK
eukprot:746617-Hanusia_phi.AAC.9